MAIGLHSHGVLLTLSMSLDHCFPQIYISSIFTDTEIVPASLVRSVQG